MASPPLFVSLARGGSGGDFHDSGQMIVIIFPSQSVRPSAHSLCGGAAAQSNERDFYELCDIGQWGKIEAVSSRPTRPTNAAFARKPR